MDLRNSLVWHQLGETEYHICLTEIYFAEVPPSYLNGGSPRRIILDTGTPLNFHPVEFPLLAEPPSRDSTGTIQLGRNTRIPRIKEDG
jgi:hypothetical protein